MQKLLAGLFLSVISSFAYAAGGLVSLGGSVTEIIYALGREERLIATDLSSSYPEQVNKLPQVGYYRSISIEGLLSVKPELILASENSGPKDALDRLEALGVKVQRVSDKGTLDSLYERITQIAQILEAEEQGENLLQKIKTDVDKAMSMPTKPYRAALVVNRTGTLQAAGTATSADELMHLAGFENIFSKQKSYKPVSKESFLALQPDIIITTTASVEASGGLEQFSKEAVIANTPAATANRIVVLDDLLALGMGPRVGQAIRQLKESH